MHRVTLRIDEDVKRQLDLMAAKNGIAPAAYARSLVERGVMEDAERAWAPLVRRAVREELDSFLSSARMDREFAADDLYGRLANELRMDIDDLRMLSGSAISLLLGGGADDEQKREALKRAMDDARSIGFGFVAEAAFTDDDIAGDDGAWL